MHRLPPPRAWCRACRSAARRGAQRPSTCTTRPFPAAGQLLNARPARTWNAVTSTGLPPCAPSTALLAGAGAGLPRPRSKAPPRRRTSSDAMIMPVVVRPRPIWQLKIRAASAGGRGGVGGLDHQHARLEMVGCRGRNRRVSGQVGGLVEQPQLTLGSVSCDADACPPGAAMAGRRAQGAEPVLCLCCACGLRQPGRPPSGTGTAHGRWVSS